MAEQNRNEPSYCQFDNRKNLLGLLGMSVASGILLAVLASFGTLANSERDRYLNRLIDRTADYLRAASALRLSHSVADYEAIFSPMVEEGVLAGVLVLDDRGGVIKFLGDVPSIDLRERLNNPGAYHRADDGCCIDVILGKAETKFDHDVELRIPAMLGNQGGLDAFKYWGWFALFGAALGIVAALLIGFVFVVQPLHAFNRSFAQLIQSRAEATAFNYEKSTAAKGHHTGRDAKPLGKFANGLADFQASLAANLPNKAKEFAQALEMLPTEVLVFDQRGQLQSANEAALRLYRAKNISELQRRGLCRFERAYEAEPNPRGILELLEEGTLDFEAVVFIGQEGEPRRLVAREMYNEFGKRQGYMVALLVPQPGGMVAAAAVSPPLDRQSAILKLQLEACLTLLKTHDSAELQSQSQPVRCDLIVESWFLAMAASGLICDDMTHDLPGQMNGDYDTVESLLRLALTVVALRSQVNAPSLVANGSLQNDGELEFVFKEAAGAKLLAITNGSAEVADTEEWKLSLAALSRLLRAYGGKIAALRGLDDGNLIKLVLPSRGHGVGRPDVATQRSAA